jgi:hypothetical protein
MRLLPHEIDPGISPPRSVTLLRNQDVKSYTQLIEAGISEAVGAVPIALDPSAAVALIERRIRFTTIDGWLLASGQGSHDIPGLANLLRTQRMTGTGRLFIDRWVETNLWGDLLLAHRLGSALRICDVKESFIALEYASSRDGWEVAVKSVRAEAFQGASATLPGTLSGPGWVYRLRLCLSGSPLGPLLRAIRRQSSQLNLHQKVRKLRVPGGGPLLAIVLSRREIQRSGEVVASIASAYGDAVRVIPWETSVDAQAHAAEFSRHPVLLLPINELLSAKETRRQRAVARCDINRMSLGELTPHRESVIGAFLAQAEHRAAAIQRSRTLIKALCGLRVSAVLTARIGEDSRALVESIAETGLAVMTVPHGVVMAGSQTTLADSDRVIQLAGLADPTCAGRRPRYCPEVLHRYEYPHRVRAVKSSLLTGRGLRVLAISDGFPTIGLHDHAEILRALSGAANALSEQIEIAFKPHPGTPSDEEILLAAFSDPQHVQLASRDLDLHELLDRSDLVLAVNSAGSALVHAIRKGLPVALLWGRSPRDAVSSNDSSMGWLRFWSESLPLLMGESDLTMFLQRYVEDAGYRQALGAASVAIASRLFPVDGAERLEDLVRELRSVESTPLTVRD